MKVHPVVPCLPLTVTGAAPYHLLATVPSPALKVTKRQSDGDKSNYHVCRPE